MRPANEATPLLPTPNMENGYTKDKRKKVLIVGAGAAGTQPTPLKRVPSPTL